MYGRGKIRIKFLDYSTSREYMVLSQPGIDLILGTSTLEEL
jgi:hypothetical protein